MRSKLVRNVQLLFKIRFFESILIFFIKLAPGARFLRKFAPQNTEYSINEIRICKRNGLKYKLFLNDYQQWLIYFDCDYDSSFDVLKHVQKGDTIIDVGGNIGQTAMMLSKKVGESGKVISFEPFPDTFKLFHDNLNLNPEIKNIVNVNYGLGENDLTVGMVKECDTNSGGNRISHEESDVDNSVKITTLDTYLLRNPEAKINLIKIDVEGYEMKVLNGAKNLLSKFKPHLYIEIDDINLKKQNNSADEMIQFLTNYGYKIYQIPGDKLITKYAEMDPKSRDIYCKPVK